MKKATIIIATLAMSFLSCSKDDGEEPLVSNETVEVYQQTFDDAVGFMERTSTVNMVEATEYLRSLEGVTNISVEDSMIHVTTQGNVTFVLDFNSYPEYVEGNIDMERMQQRIEAFNHEIDADIASGYEATSEVFKDYIAQNSTSDDIPNVETVQTRASSVKRVQLSRKNVAIWNPWKDFEGDTKQVANVTAFINKEHSLKSFKSFVPASYQYFKNFDVIFLSTHGLPNGDIVIPFDCLTKEQLDLYNKETGRVQLYWVKNKGKKHYKGLILTKSFFDKYLPDLSNTVLYTSACHLGVDNSTFLRSCLQKNVADYFASDTECTGEDIMSHFEEFYIYLMNGLSTHKSFVEGKGYFIGKNRDGHEPATYKYSRYGSKLVYYPIAHATGVGRQNNANKTPTRNNDPNSSAVIVNAQLRYPSEESDDILKSIEAGICLQDMETKQVTLIPFTDKNIVSHEKKTYGDVTVSTISASLDDLTEDHQYAYCCYTKVDGEISLSDECYQISDSYRLTIKYNNHIEFHTVFHYVHSDGSESVDEGKDSELDREASFVVYKINGKYYIPSTYGLPNLLPTDNTVTENKYIARADRETAYDVHGAAQCTLVADNLHLTYSYSYKIPYGNGYMYVQSTNEINILNMDTEPTASWPGENSLVLEIFSTDNILNKTHKWCDEIDTYTNTYIGFERAEIPEEEMASWEKRAENGRWCELVNRTK